MSVLYLCYLSMICLFISVCLLSRYLFIYEDLLFNKYLKCFDAVYLFIFYHLSKLGRLYYIADTLVVNSCLRF